MNTSIFFNSSYIATRKDAIKHDNASFIESSGLSFKEYMTQSLQNEEREIYSWIRPEQQEAFEKLSSSDKNKVMLALIELL